MKVEFVIIGAQKSGTSALHYYLNLHPKIFMPSIKELHYFDNDEMYAQNVIDHSEYERHFWDSDNLQIRGEATPIYSYWIPSMERMYNYNPSFKLIMILRNPVNRAFSQWNMEFSRNNEILSFEDAIESEMKRIHIFGQNQQHRITSYISRGFYSNQIQRIFQYFDKNQVCFIKYEEFLFDPIVVLNRVYSFLEIETFDFKKLERKNIFKLPYSTSLTRSFKAKLLDLFSEEIEKTECLLHWNCNDWREI